MQTSFEMLKLKQIQFEMKKLTKFEKIIMKIWIQKVKNLNAWALSHYNLRNRQIYYSFMIAVFTIWIEM